MKKSLGWLVSFFKIGCIGFGGGTSLIPVIEQEMVQNRKLITKNEYDEDVIVASITPGALPVEISGSIGKRFWGWKGMMLAALLMALPGALFTVLLLSGITSVSGEVLKQIEIVSIGITAFIISMLTRYVTNTFQWARKKDKNHARFAVAIIIAVFLLNSGKSLFKILGFFGIEGTPPFSISTVDILIITFFVLLYTKCKYRKGKIIVCTAVGLLYLLCNSNLEIVQTEYNIYITRTLQFVMFFLSVYGIVTDKEMTINKTGANTKNFIKEELVWILFLGVLSIPAIMLLPEFLEYISRGYASSVISFGGGDAYLTVADSMFVENGMIQESDFYGHLVTIVNVLPGSILCKTLTGVGYYLGYGISGSVIEGYAVALSGFACSIVGSCSVVSFVQYIIKLFRRIKALEVLTTWIKTIISGLLGSVILSLVFQSLMVARTYGCSEVLVIVELLLIYLLNILLSKYTKLSTGLRVVISGVISIAIGNIIM